MIYTREGTQIELVAHADEGWVRATFPGGERRVVALDDLRATGGYPEIMAALDKLKTDRLAVLSLFANDVIALLVYLRGDRTPLPVAGRYLNNPVRIPVAEGVAAARTAAPWYDGERYAPQFRAAFPDGSERLFFLYCPSISYGDDRYEEIAPYFATVLWNYREEWPQ